MMETYLEDRGAADLAPATDYRKKVILIGDSIREGYCNTVAERLAPIADVRYPKGNCRNTQFTYVSLASWSGLFPDPREVDLIYWNNGHWDVAHWGGDAESLNSPEVYCAMLLRIRKRLAEIYPSAKIVFASTTPMNPNGSIGCNPRSNDEIRAYNAAAERALSGACGFDDLYAFCADWGEEYFHDYCHFSKEGFRLLGNRVAERIAQLL